MTVEEYADSVYRFILGNLKDEDKAGVTGLNKLFGWQMALDKKNDENGQPKSVYFSSKILKFNAPVKKREPQL